MKPVCTLLGVPEENQPNPCIRHVVKLLSPVPDALHRILNSLPGVVSGRRATHFLQLEDFCMRGRDVVLRDTRHATTRKTSQMTPQQPASKQSYSDLIFLNGFSLTKSAGAEDVRVRSKSYQRRTRTRTSILMLFRGPHGVDH